MTNFRIVVGDEEKPHTAAAAAAALVKGIGKKVKENLAKIEGRPGQHNLLLLFALFTTLRLSSVGRARR